MGHVYEASNESSDGRCDGKSSGSGARASRGRWRVVDQSRGDNSSVGIIISARNG